MANLIALSTIIAITFTGAAVAKVDLIALALSFVS